MWCHQFWFVPIDNVTLGLKFRKGESPHQSSSVIVPGHKKKKLYLVSDHHWYICDHHQQQQNHQQQHKKEEFKVYEPNFRRNFVHISDISEAFLFSIKNFSNLKSNIFNLGLNNANITKIQLCEKIKKYLPEFKFEISHDQKDPDQRDYFVSNEKLKKANFEAKYSLEQGIQELIKYFTFNTAN